jgi:hypothetical protein
MGIMRKVYRLRSNLNKTTVYKLLKEVAPSELDVPVMRKCEFQKHDGIFWLKFSAGDSYYKVALQTFASITSIRCYVQSYERFHDIFAHKVFSHNFSFEYLQEHGLLQEVEIS